MFKSFVNQGRTWKNSRLCIVHVNHPYAWYPIYGWSSFYILESWKGVNFITGIAILSVSKIKTKNTDKCVTINVMQFLNQFHWQQNDSFCAYVRKAKIKFSFLVFHKQFVKEKKQNDKLHKRWNTLLKNSTGKNMQQHVKLQVLVSELTILHRRWLQGLYNGKYCTILRPWRSTHRCIFILARSNCQQVSIKTLVEEWGGWGWGGRKEGQVMRIQI